MKRFLIAILAVMASICLFCACDNQKEQADPSTPPSGADVSQKGDSEFPDNDYKQDNEVVYPNVWD